MPKHKRVLIVEGGGADGLCAIGAIKYLIRERYHTYDAMFGTSIGAAIVLGLACIEKEDNTMFSAVTELADRMSDLTKWDLIKRPAFFGFFNGGYLVSKIKQTVHRLYAKDYRIGHLKTPCRVFTTDYDAEEPIKVLGDIYRVDDAVAMSTNIPGVFCFYKDPYSEHRCFDGGIAVNDPIAYAVEYAEQHHWENVSYDVIRLGTYVAMKHNYFMTASATLLHGFEIARLQCERLSIKLSKVYDNADIHILHIPYNIGLLAFNPKHNKTFIQRGFDYADQNYN